MIMITIILLIISLKYISIIITFQNFPIIIRIILIIILTLSFINN